jgi:hypothetical protein
MRSAENPSAGQGPVVLDVGGNVGALLVKMPASFEGVEIEIRPGQPATESPHHQHEHHHEHEHEHRHEHAEHSHLTHVEVLPRPTPGGFLHCAVFPSLCEGSYELSERPFGDVALEVTVTGGKITQASWPTVGPPGTV